MAHGGRSGQRSYPSGFVRLAESMGRSPFARKHTLWMSSVATVVGLALTILAYTAEPTAGGWNAFYEQAVPMQTSEGSWNLLIKVVAPIVLVSGGWYLGEQILARRKFENLIEIEKKSAFQDNYEELREQAGKLPKRYEERLDEKADEFLSRR